MPNGLLLRQPHLCPGRSWMAGAPAAGQSQETPAAGGSASQLCELGGLAHSPAARVPHQDKGLVKVEVIHPLRSTAEGWYEDVLGECL